MRRRNFLLGLLAAPLARLLPVPKLPALKTQYNGIPVYITEDLKVTESVVT